MSLNQMRRELDRLEASLNPGAGQEFTPAQKLKIVDMIVRKYEDDRPAFERMAQKYPGVRGVIDGLKARLRKHQSGLSAPDDNPAPPGGEG